jgi:hypothetical protein
MTKDERSNARLLLEAYELIGIVLDRALDYCERVHGNENDPNGPVEPLDRIQESILKRLVLALDNDVGMVGWVDDIEDKVRKEVGNERKEK